jgi:hypothetical protein
MVQIEKVLVCIIGHRATHNQKLELHPGKRQEKLLRFEGR